jgi:hypothetical protein
MHLQLNLSDQLGVLGIVVGIVSLFITIVLAIRKRYPGRLGFVTEDHLGLVSSLATIFPEIKIQYNGQPVSDQMTYLKASFINLGTIDLSTKRNDHKLKIRLEKDVKWLNCKITKMSAGVTAEVKVKENELDFDFDLLKKNEFIQFEAIAETYSENSLIKALNFEHRIPNTGKIEKLGALDNKPFSSLFIFGIFIMTLLITFGVIYTIFFQFDPNLRFINHENGMLHEVIFYAKSADEMIMHDLTNDRTTTISFNQYSNLNLTPTRSKKNGLQLSRDLYLMLASFAAFLSVTVPLFLNFYRGRKLIRKLSQKT